LLAGCQLKVTGWDIMFICGMLFWCAGTLNIGLESGPVTAEHVNNVKPVHSLSVTLNFFLSLYQQIEIKDAITTPKINIE